MTALGETTMNLSMALQAGNVGESNWRLSSVCMIIT